MTRRKTNPLAVLRQICLSAGSRFEPEPVLQNCVEALGQALGASRCLIHQRDAAGHMHVSHEWSERNVLPFGIGNQLLTPSAYLCHQTLATVAVNDVLEDARFQEAMDRQLFRQTAVRSALAAPISSRNQELGLLEVHRCKRAHKWTQADIELVETASAHVAIVLQSARVLAEQERLTHSLANMNQDLSRLYVELATKDEQIDRFMHLISHDLRAPVVAIEGLVNLLKQQYESEAPDSKPRRYLELIMRSAEQITGLTGALLEYAKLGQSNIQLQQVDCDELVREIWQRLTIATNDVDLEIFTPLPVVRADRAMLARIFQNLLENALKYRKPAGRALVDVTCTETDTHWQFAVNDDGIGFHPSESAGLFDIFTRLKHARTKPGSGIGLASVLELARLHRGSAWATGRPGKGATFYFTLAKEIGELTAPPVVSATAQ